MIFVISKIKGRFSLYIGFTPAFSLKVNINFSIALGEASATDRENF